MRARARGVKFVLIPVRLVRVRQINKRPRRLSRPHNVTICQDLAARQSYDSRAQQQQGVATHSAARSHGRSAGFSS
jgi:hypothetical protein